MNLFSFLCLSLTPAAANAGQETLDVHYPRLPQALILSPSGSHYPEITRALSSVGFRLREISAAGYLAAARNKDVLLIVPEPEGRQLDPTLLRTILHDVELGMPLLLDGAPYLGKVLSNGRQVSLVLPQGKHTVVME